MDRPLKKGLETGEERWGVLPFPGSTEMRRVSPGESYRAYVLAGL